MNTSTISGIACRLKCSAEWSSRLLEKKLFRGVELNPYVIGEVANNVSILSQQDI